MVRRLPAITRRRASSARRVPGTPPFVRQEAHAARKVVVGAWKLQPIVAPPNLNKHSFGQKRPLVSWKRARDLPPRRQPQHPGY